MWLGYSHQRRLAEPIRVLCGLDTAIRDSWLDQSESCVVRTQPSEVPGWTNQSPVWTGHSHQRVLVGQIRVLCGLDTDGCWLNQSEYMNISDHVGLFFSFKTLNMSKLSCYNNICYMLFKILFLRRKNVALIKVLVCSFIVVDWPNCWCMQT